jgi:hypothetical protein
VPRRFGNRRLAQIRQGPCKQVELTAHRQAHGARGIGHGGDGRRRQAGRAVDGAHGRALHQLRRESAADKGDARQFLAQRGEQGRRFARVGDRHMRPVARAPARHGQAGRTQAQDQHGLVL